MSEHRLRTRRSGPGPAAAPGPWQVLRAATAMEFLMAARSRATWVAVVPLLMFVVIALLLPGSNQAVLSPAQRIANLALFINVIVLIGVCVAMTGKLMHVHRLGLEEALRALPARPAIRLLGGLAGSLSAMLLAPAMVLLLAGMLSAVKESDPGLVLSAIAAFLVIVMPAAAFGAVASALAGLLMPVPLARVLSVAGWYWMTMFNRWMFPLPSPVGTVFSPLGDYAAAAWWQTERLRAGLGKPEFLSPDTATSSAIVNLAVIFTLTAILTIAAYYTSSWRCRSVPAS